MSVVTGYSAAEREKRENPSHDLEQRENEKLAEQAKLGDTEAFGELMRRHRSRAYKWAMAVTTDGHLAEDIVQDAFMKAFIHIESLVDSTRFLGWLKRIVRNQSLMRVRRGGPFRREQPFSSLVQVTDEGRASNGVDWGDLDSILNYMTYRTAASHSGDPAERLIRLETINLITSLLYCLNRKERAIFESYFFKQWSPETISVLFQTTTRTVYSSIQRSKHKVREEHAKGVWQIGNRRGLSGKEEGAMKLLNIPDIQKTEAAYSLMDRMAKMIRAAGGDSRSCELMAESGFAFRTKISRHSIYADGAFVFDWMGTIKNVLESCGFSPQFLYGQLPVLQVPLMAIIESFPAVREEPGVLSGFVRRFINADMPVLVFDTYVQRPFIHEWNLIYGYDDKREEVYMTDSTPPYTKTITYIELAHIPLRFLCGIEPKQAGNGLKKAAISAKLQEASATAEQTQRQQWGAALRKAVRMTANGDGFVFASGFLSYASGLSAYDTWIAHLEHDESAAFKYGHNYLAYVYADARHHASEYLRLMIERLDMHDRTAQPLKALLLQAATAYSETADSLSAARAASLFPDQTIPIAAKADVTAVRTMLKQAKDADHRALEYLKDAITILEHMEADHS